MRIFQIGSSLKNESTANDIDLIIVSDKPVDICLYSKKAWAEFQLNGFSETGKRVVLHPNQGRKLFPENRKELFRDDQKSKSKRKN
jgi:hypothetical protein